ncbi:acyl-CoA dehydrogenase family protein [Acidiferrimicrobium sp. IK]|uniref:acyl-CoA dehydrogenase family protein n=1 Tax=Acidiferrimicrobium sp. IK TaxID=2871700 RepID=UPI0021CB576B|nr:acyl-CoA dehydrogenase family protein [Acidiferrimicrobium sp. IK]
MRTGTPDPPFVFGAEHRQFEESVAKLARGQFHDGYLQRATTDDMCWDELAELGRHGLLGMGLPAELGGQDADPIARGIACEQVARADFNLAYLVFGSELAAALVRGSPPEIAHPLVRDVTAGRRLIALALTEPRGGSDASGTSVRAHQVDGGYRLSGEKTSVTLGMHASHAITVATVDPGAGSRGTRRFLVPLDDQSISRQSFADPGFRPLSRAALNFDDTFVPDDHEMTDAGSGLSAVLSDFDLTRTLLGLMVIGAARRAIDATVEWVREREAFGRPIAGFQGVSFTLAEHDTQLEAARWLCYRALGLRTAGLPHTREAAMCKWWAPRLAVQAINDCIVLHGHVGWSSEMPLQQLLLDVSGLQIGDGTPQIQKLVIARHLIGRDYVG